VDARTWQADQDVAGGALPTVDQVGLVDHSDRKTGQVVLAFLVETGKLRRFAADKRTAGLSTPLDDSFDDLQRHAHFKVPAGDVIKEKEGARARCEDVVHTHRDQVDSDGVVNPRHEGELQLGADAVGTRDQHRTLHSRHVRRHGRGESTHTRHHLGRQGGLDHSTDPGRELVTDVYVDASLLVGQFLVVHC